MKYVSEMYPRPALVTSEALAWRGVRVEHHQSAAMELPAHYHEQHLLLLYQADNPVFVRQQQGSQLQQGLFQAGSVGLYPGGDYGKVVWNGPTDTIHLFVDDQYLEHLARQHMDLTRFNLCYRFQFNDPFLSQLGRQLLNAVGTYHALGLLYVESLTSALCYHLIEHYAQYEQRIQDGHRLSNTVLARIDTYLEGRADQSIRLETLAGLANLSVFHFARLFKRTTGVSPYQYVIRWKIQRACELLRTDQDSITSISDTLGIASPAHFSAAFKRTLGMNPREFQRAKPGPLNSKIQ
ncbi:AraC family transcriptional regulator [Spirosoma knui]